MECELARACADRDAARADTEARVDMKHKKLWAVSHALRAEDTPDMTDEERAALVELAYLSVFPLYRNVPLLTVPEVIFTANTVPAYRQYFRRIVRLAHELDSHGDRELATDADWEAWIAAL